MPVSVISKKLVQDIDHLAKEHKGSALLKFVVYDPENNMQLEMFSRTAKVDPTDAFLGFFDDQPDVTYRIN